jgi:hypothetical protein
VERAAGWDEARGGLTFLFWGWLAHAIAIGLGVLYVNWVGQWSGAAGGLLGPLLRSHLMSFFFIACQLSGLAVAFVGVVRLVRAPVETRIRSLVVVALICFIGVALVYLLNVAVMVHDLAKRGGYPSLTFGFWLHVSVASGVAHGTGMIAILVVLYAIARRVHALLPFWFGVIASAVIGFDMLLGLYSIFGDPLSHIALRSPWLWMFMSVGALLAKHSLFLLLIAKTRGKLLADSGAAQAEKDWEGAAGWFGAKEWQAPTRGVALYAGALKTLVLIVFGGYGAVVASWVLKLSFIATITLMALPIAMLITQVVMMVALAWYASVPPVSGARGLALAALAAHALALLVDIVSIVALAGVLARGSEYTYEADVALARAQLVGGFGQALGLIGFLLLILSFARTARFVGAAELAGKAMPVVIMVVVTAAAILLMRLVMSSRHVVHNAGAGLLALAIGVGFLALTSLLMYMSFVNKLHGVLIEGPPETGPMEEQSWG